MKKHSVIFFLLCVFCTHEITLFAQDNKIQSNVVEMHPNLKILSWNIYMLPALVPMKGRVERAEKIVDTLKQMDYEIIIFQEAFHKKAVEKITKGLSAYFPFIYGPFNPSTSPFKISSGVLVMSKIPLEVLKTIEFAPGVASDYFAKKGAALLQGEFHGKRFQIIGTHMQAESFGTAIRKTQFQNIFDQLVMPFKEEGVPQLLCGDMNAERCIATEYGNMLKTLEAENGDIEGIHQDTYDGTTNGLALAAWKRAKTNFDYILLRRNGAQIKTMRRMVAIFKRQWKKGHNDLSDHYGITCELRF